MALFCLRRLVGPRPLLLALGLLALLLMQPLGSKDAEAALTNPGFESGLSGWTTGTTTEGVFAVVGNDTIHPEDAPGAEILQAPLEGGSMARLGNVQFTDQGKQSVGPNELIQTFTIDSPSVKFAYNVWTFDYTGFDEFKIDLRLVASDTVIYSYMQQAWGSGTARKNSGWQVVDIPVGQYQGEQARLTFTAGGSKDTLYAFWVYVDSAAKTVPAQVVNYGGVLVNGFHPSKNPANQTIEIVRFPEVVPFHIEIPVKCPDGSDPVSVTLIIGTSPPFPVTLAKGPFTWGADIPTPPQLQLEKTYPLTLVIDCPPTTITINVGSITLIDPSGFITDAVTGQPIPEATVTLQRLENGNWVDVNPYALVDGNPTVMPQVNPELTDDTGHYGWDVIAGTYRVVVEKTGYTSKTSPQVTVPPPVLDLNLALQPAAAGLPIEQQLGSCLAMTNVSWSFANQPKVWSSFDPDLPDSLQGFVEFLAGSGYFVNVSANCTIVSGNNNIQLYTGWNLFGWQ
ncbi:MAG: carboxypeptidase regulatory-like domain-containing protein [Chloroflexi bacterium]|nr:carboxypeptidase regulatory-like domain-containing protein [Chloroflexota bacterium]